MHPNTKNFFCQWGPVLSTEQLVLRHCPLSTWYLQPPGTPTRPLLKVPYTYLGAAGFAERGVAPLGAAGFAECGVDSTGLSAAARTNAGVFMETSGGKQCLRNRTLFSEFLQPAVLLQQTEAWSAVCTSGPELHCLCLGWGSVTPWTSTSAAYGISTHPTSCHTGWRLSSCQVLSLPCLIF